MESWKSKVSAWLDRADPIAGRIDTYWGATKVIGVCLVMVVGAAFFLLDRFGTAWFVSLILALAVLVLAFLAWRLGRELKRRTAADTAGLGGTEGTSPTPDPGPAPASSPEGSKSGADADDDSSSDADRREEPVRSTPTATAAGLTSGETRHEPTRRYVNPRSDAAVADRLQEFHDEGQALLERCHVSTLTQALAVGGGQPDETEVVEWTRTVETALVLHPMLLSKFRRKDPPLANLSGSRIFMTEVHRELRTRMGHLNEIIQSLRRLDLERDVYDRPH